MWRVMERLRRGTRVMRDGGVGGGSGRVRGSTMVTSHWLSTPTNRMLHIFASLPALDSVPTSRLP